MCIFYHPYHGCTSIVKPAKFRVKHLKWVGSMGCQPIFTEIVLLGELALNIGLVKSAHKHMQFFGGLFFDIVFSNFEINML
jgi:hypothetical protein